MRNVPLVSVIVAAYDVEKYIEQAVMSALAQTVWNIEVIVVDDESTDKTVSTVQKLADGRIKLFQNAFNRGPSCSRNLGITKARGEWIAILDADDWWAPDRLEILLQIAEQEEAHIVCDDLFLIKDGAEHPWDTYLKSRERAIGTINQVTVVTPSKMIDDDYGKLHPMFKKDFLAKCGARYKEHLRFAEDHVFVLDCLVHGAKMTVYPHPYYYYRSRVGSLTNSRLATTKNHHGLLVQLLATEPYNQFSDGEVAEF